MLVTLQEHVSQGRGLRVNRKDGYLERVRVLGYQSANNRTYLRSGIRPEVYESKRVVAGHGRQGVDPDPRDVYGYIEGVTVEDRGVYARRLQLLHPSGEFQQRILDCAEKAPWLMGLSHEAQGKTRHGPGGLVVESVERVSAVAIVVEPATTRGFAEGRTMTGTIGRLVDWLRPRNARYARALREAVSGVMTDEDEAASPPEEDRGEADHERALRDGLEAAWVAVFRDDTLDAAGKIAKARKLLATLEDLLGGPAAAEESLRRWRRGLREERHAGIPSDPAARARWLRG